MDWTRLNLGPPPGQHHRQRQRAECASHGGGSTPNRVGRRPRLPSQTGGGTKPPALPERRAHLPGCVWRKDVCYNLLTIPCISLAHHVRLPPSIVQGPLRPCYARLGGLFPASSPSLQLVFPFGSLENTSNGIPMCVRAADTSPSADRRLPVTRRGLSARSSDCSSWFL